jgi:hypothetical protein
MISAREYGFCILCLPRLVIRLSAFSQSIFTCEFLKSQQQNYVGTARQEQHCCCTKLLAVDSMTTVTATLQPSSVSTDAPATVDMEILLVTIQSTTCTGSGSSWTCAFDRFGSGLDFDAAIRARAMQSSSLSYPHTRQLQAANEHRPISNVTRKIQPKKYTGSGSDSVGRVYCFDPFHSLADIEATWLDRLIYCRMPME